MKRLSFLLIMGIILSGISLTSCKKDSSSTSSNNTPVIGVSIQAINPQFNLPVTTSTLKALSATSLINVTSAKLKVSKLSFEAELKTSNKAHDSVSVEFNWFGTKVVDLLNPGPTFAMINLMPGFYDELELRVLSLHNMMDSVPIFNLTGTFTDSAMVVTPVVFTVNESVLLQTEMKNDTITSTTGSTLTGAVKIALDQLFVGITPAELNHAVKTNGTIVISATSNRDLFLKIAVNFLKRHHGEFHHHGI